MSDKPGFIYYYKSAIRYDLGMDATLPRGWVRFDRYPERQYVAAIDAMAYGEVETSRQLEPWEVARYGLIAAPVE